MWRVLLLGGQKGWWKPYLAAVRKAGIELEARHLAHPGRLSRKAASNSCQLILASPHVEDWPPDALASFLPRNDSPDVPCVLIRNISAWKPGNLHIRDLMWDWVSAREAERLPIVVRRALKYSQLRQTLLHERSRQAGISHDVSNLLTVVLGNAEFLSARLRTEKSLQRAIQAILHAGELAASWMKGSMAPDQAAQSSCDLNRVIAGLEGLLRSLAPKGVQIDVRRGTGAVPVAADPTHIARVILNLVMNALDAMPRGGRLTITARQTQKRAAASGNWGKITVSDTGAGIERGKRSRIFAPSYTSKEGHHGFGLPVVRALVEGNGGFLELESAPGSGTTFCIYFPSPRSFVSSQVEAPAGFRQSPGSHAHPRLSMRYARKVPSPACGQEPFGGRRPVPRRLEKAPAAVHALPTGEGCERSEQRRRAGEGSFTIPVDLDVTPEAPAVPDALTAGSKMVLVAEDDPQLREIILRILRSAGYGVLEARDTQQAFEVQQSRPGSIGLLLTDIRMAPMNGLDLARAMRAAEPEIRVIFISGYPDARAIAGGNESRFLLKPFRPAALLQKVHEAFQERDY